MNEATREGLKRVLAMHKDHRDLALDDLSRAQSRVDRAKKELNEAESAIEAISADLIG